MLKIYKYVLESELHGFILMPTGAKILSVQCQKGKICVWAIVDPTALESSYHFYITGTGCELFEDPEEYNFLTTLQIKEEDQSETWITGVWHVFIEKQGVNYERYL